MALTFKKVRSNTIDILLDQSDKFPLGNLHKSAEGWKFYPHPHHGLWTTEQVLQVADALQRLNANP